VVYNARDSGVNFGYQIKFYRIFIARSELRKVLFLAPSLCGFFVCTWNISGTANWFAPNSHKRRVWSLARRSLKVKGKGQRPRSPAKKRHFSALSAACVRFMFG